MTVVQLEIYNYCRALGLNEAAALKAAAASRTRAEQEKVRRRIRLFLWALGAALLLTAAAEAMV